MKLRTVNLLLSVLVISLLTGCGTGSQGKLYDTFQEPGDQSFNTYLIVPKAQQGNTIIEFQREDICEQDACLVFKFDDFKEDGRNVHRRLINYEVDCEEYEFRQWDVKLYRKDGKLLFTKGGRQYWIDFTDPNLQVKRHSLNKVLEYVCSEYAG